VKKIKALGPDVGLNLDYKELPIGATQIGFNPNLMKTGTWRFNRPIFAPGAAPCHEACPAGVDIRKIIGLIREGQIAAALESYLEENPFPSICGRVCAHPCEKACNRGSYGAAVSINGLENYLSGNLPLQTLLVENNGKRVAIIGSGPAGLACGYFLRRLGYGITVFERDSQAGGILRYGIPEYRLPKDILDLEIQKLTALGIDIRTKKELGQNLTMAELKDYDALFVATGAYLSIIPEITGIDVEGVYNGLDFLKAVAMGKIKSFAKRVAVIGGGNTAVDAARTILRLSGTPIIYYRRSQEELPAIVDEIKDCQNEGIEFQYLVTPVKVISDQNKITGVEFIRNRLGEPDSSQRRAPIPIAGSNFQVQAEAVILATGEGTDIKPFSGLLDTQQQLIKVNELSQTSVSQIFAGGDIVHTRRTVVDAIRSGKQAAIGIDCYLKGSNKKEILRLLQSIATNDQGGLSFKQYLAKEFTQTRPPVTRYEDLNPSYFEHLARNERQELAVESRISSFQEVRAKFPAEAAIKEAERCFSCGQCNSCGNCFVLCPDGSVSFDKDKEIALQMEYNYDYCKGCGICMEECPRGVIQMVQEE
jgi:2-oxoacid:acceptor oxidoreductase delta subunit (pyruvate/2-ketoisovalerate family)